jgi:hypothetical protein
MSIPSLFILEKLDDVKLSEFMELKYEELQYDLFRLGGLRRSEKHSLTSRNTFTKRARQIESDAHVPTSRWWLVRSIVLFTIFDSLP